MTGFLLLFTGFIASISNQGQTPYCASYAIANCASVYGMKEDGYSIARNELFTTVDTFPFMLIKLTRFNISSEYHATTGQISEKLKHGPLLILMSPGVVIDGYTLPYGHYGCLEGETNNEFVIAGSRDKNYGVQGHQRVSKSQINLMMFQDFGSGNLTAQLTGIKTPEPVKPIVKVSKFKKLKRK